MVNAYTGTTLQDTNSPRTFKFYGYFLNKTGRHFYWKFAEQITSYIYNRNRGNVTVNWELLPRGEFILFKINRIDDEGDICPNGFNFGDPDEILEELNDFFLDDPIFFGTDWVKMMDADCGDGVKKYDNCVKHDGDSGVGTDDVCQVGRDDSGVGTDVDKKKCMEELEKMAGKDETWKAIYDFINKIVNS